jgi:hypothetical protein
MSSAEKNLKELCEFWNIYDKQRFFISAIGIYDKLFVDSIGPDAKKLIKPYYDRIIRYSYPVFIRTFYDQEFEKLPGVALKPIDGQLQILYTKLIYSCGIIGWMQSMVDDVKAGYLSYTSLFNYVRIKFKEKYHWNEYLEKEYLTWYSVTIAQLQQNEYEKLNAKLPEILDKISRSVFVWRDHFMGYSNDIETEVYFNEHAYLDAKQTVEWDMFSPECLFGNIRYGDIVQAIIDFSGYSIKHIYCANVLKTLYPKLINENLFTCIFTEDDLVHLIVSNQKTDIKNAKTILDTLSLTSKKGDYYNHTSASCAPLIKVSEQQYIRSIRGFLDGAFEFALFRLHNSFPKDWDRNVNTREKTFKEHLYMLFDNDRFLCVPHAILLESNGKVSTDIDAAVVDKVTGEIALFQLKWQDPTSYSSFALKSKKNNYNEQTQKWINVVDTWLKNSSEAELASKIGIKKKYIKKDKVLLFVLGRHHGNYSGISKPTSKCAWVQWYQLLQTILYLNQKQELSLTRIHDDLIQTNPFNRRIIERRSTFVYGKYRIHYGG